MYHFSFFFSPFQLAYTPFSSFFSHLSRRTFHILTILSITTLPNTLIPGQEYVAFSLKSAVLPGFNQIYYVVKETPHRVNVYDNCLQFQHFPRQQNYFSLRFRLFPSCQYLLLNIFSMPSLVLSINSNLVNVLKTVGHVGRN